MPSIPVDPPHLPPDLAFSALDEALPLALLPLRLEVRFWKASTPAELRVRIFPDLVHADGHLPELTALEQKLGRAFWVRCWRAGPVVAAKAGSPTNGTGPSGQAGRDAAFAWLAGQLGPWRAAWVAAQMRPLNDQAAPTRAVPDGLPLRPAPQFPNRAERAAGAPTYARLLPERFALVAWENEAIVGTWWGEPVAEDLVLAPGLLDGPDVNDGRDLLDAQGLRWTYDFDEAVGCGMAIRVSFATLDDRYLRTGFTRLLVVGARAGDQGQELEALLEAHRYTHGLDFAGQGAPTNATETTAPGLVLDRPDLAAVRAAELDPAPAKRALIPIPGDGNGELYRLGAADAAVSALGLSDGTALERALNAGLTDLRDGEAIARVLWPAVLGHYLDALMDTGLAAADRTWLRDWSTHYVRGGAILPTLLVGAQPYGLLPITLSEFPADPADRIEHLEVVLRYLRNEWEIALPEVARLDPRAGDEPPGEGERSALVSQILGAVPHPLAFALQAVDDMRGQYQFDWDFILGLVMLNCAAAGRDSVPSVVPKSWDDTSVDGQMSGSFWNEWEAARDALMAATTPSYLTDALEGLADDAKGRYEVIESTARSLAEQVDAHVSRTQVAAWLQSLVPGISFRVDDGDDPKAFFDWHPSRADWALPLVDDAAYDYLSDLADQASAGTAPSESFAVVQPLLHQLAHWSTLLAAGGADGAVLAVGLRRLAQVAQAADGPARLERLLREGVSTSMNRLDAWFTGIGAWRLEGKRGTRAQGIQVGAYGWLEDVKPRRQRESQGYVLAPSAAHATTAAVLRSGWSAFGGDAESAGLAVDLSSDRLRRARWLIGGVRNGQDLGRMLGARFERRMHDGGADALIEDVRKLALAAAGISAAPTAIVDGLLLARGRACLDAPGEDYSDAERDAAGRLDDLLEDTSKPKRQRDGLADALDGALDDLDAVADAAQAQSVFSLVEGNVPEASATLSATATGEATFPRLRFADSRVTATTITHRLLLLVDPGKTGSWPGAATSGRAVAAPALEAWLEGLLGDPKRYALRAQFVDPATGATLASPVSRTLADAGLSAMDVAFLSPAGEETGLGRLGDLLSAFADGLRPKDLDPAAEVVLEIAAGDPSLADLAVAGRALRALVADARDLDGRDLAAPGAADSVSGLDAGDLDARPGAVRAALQAGRDRLAAGGDPRAAMLSLAGFQLPGGIPRGTDVAAQATALLAAVEDRLAAYDKRVADEPDWPARDRVAFLVGHELPLATRFTATDGDALDATFARRRLISPTAATEWLAAAGRVDPGARRLRVAIDLAEALLAGRGFAFALGQLPDLPSEGWAAVGLPDGDEHARLCLLSTGAAPSFAIGPVAGLVLGAWTEVIPRGRRNPALAVHFDSPSSRAPQSILLAVASPEAPFSFELIRDQVAETLDLAKLRMVGPQQLGSVGQMLPATYLDGRIPAGEAA